MVCTPVKKILASLYYIVEVKGVRDVEKIIAAARRVGIGDMALALVGASHLKCSRTGKRTICYADGDAAKAYWECSREGMRS